MQSPRLTLAIDALLRVYDHVLLDAGTASDLPAELLTRGARAVVVPDASMADGCPGPDVRSAEGGGLLRGDDAEQAVRGRLIAGRAAEPGPRSWRPDVSGSANMLRSFCAISSSAGLCLT